MGDSLLVAVHVNLTLSPTLGDAFETVTTGLSNPKINVGDLSFPLFYKHSTTYLKVINVSMLIDINPGNYFICDNKF